MLMIFGHVIQVDEYIIQIDYDTDIQKVRENIIYIIMHLNININIFLLFIFLDLIYFFDFLLFLFLTIKRHMI